MCFFTTTALWEMFYKLFPQGRMIIFQICFVQLLLWYFSSVTVLLFQCYTDGQLKTPLYKACLFKATLVKGFDKRLVEYTLIE